jgi:N-acyl-D-aspartate/D-glutamate deacylase
VAGFDLVVGGGRVIDPETGLDAVRDVGVRGGSIAAVSAAPLPGEPRLDAAGMVVAPGFVDLHSHAQTVPSLRMQALDGVTTALELEAGGYPLAAAYQAAADEGRPINYGFAASWIGARMACSTGRRWTAASRRSPTRSAAPAGMPWSTAPPPPGSWPGWTGSWPPAASASA